jgi:hypothetical protein
MTPPCCIPVAALLSVPIASFIGSLANERMVALGKHERFLAILAVLFGISAPTVIAQANTPPEPDRSYKLLREDEDWTFLRDKSLRQDFWDPIKYIQLGSNPDRYMTIGGQTRQFWEAVGNDNWGQSPFWNQYLDQRYMLSFDIHLGKHFRTFVEFKSGLSSYRFPSPRPIDEKELDFQAAFLEVGTAKGRDSIALQAGRLELEYGGGRLIDVREGPNVRLSFTGFRVLSKVRSWQIDGFAVRPDVDNFGIFDNVPNHQIGFWGVYATRPLSKKVLLDVYYLGLDRANATFQRGTAQELRHSLGGRLSRPIATERPGWDFDYESLVQFGTFGSANIRAWTTSSETGYRFPTVALKPRFIARADIASGDHPISNPGTLSTFNPLFPRGNYFGILASVGPGPLNFIDVHPRVEGTLPQNVSVALDWLFYWRQSLQDGVYSVPGSLIRAADGSQARYVGNFPGIEVRWQRSQHLWFQGDYGIFYAGPFLRQTQPGRNLNYWAAYAGYEF